MTRILIVALAALALVVFAPAAASAAAGNGNGGPVVIGPAPWSPAGFQCFVYQYKHYTVTRCHKV